MAHRPTPINPNPRANHQEKPMNLDWITIIVSALLATALIFSMAYIMEKISDWRYSRRRQREEKAERDDRQDRRLHNLESR